jgi:hypothetical protein
MLRSPKPHEASCYALGIFGKLWMSRRGAPTWFENVWSYTAWKLLIVEPFLK